MKHTDETEQPEGQGRDLRDDDRIDAGMTALAIALTVAIIVYGTLIVWGFA